MDDTFWESQKKSEMPHLRRLNPYSNGWYILSYKGLLQNNNPLIVLILILMDDTFWVHDANLRNANLQSLNPYSNGWYILRSCKDSKCSL